jgi:hypothetical protein
MAKQSFVHLSTVNLGYKELGCTWFDKKVNKLFTNTLTPHSITLQQQ